MGPIKNTFGWTYVGYTCFVLDFQESVFIKVLKIIGMLRQQAGATYRRFLTLL